MSTIHSIELLSPAKNLMCGIEAVNHGADAVYIGAPKFSARADAGNTVADIETLANYAHQYNAKVYVALNTILTDEELPEAEKIIRQVYHAGTDALIIQDMGLLETDLPPIALHASTQMDIRTPEKVKFLEQTGFSQVVLARELSAEQIKAVAEQTTVKLEVFAHGALCVSYSGQCYAGEAFCGRSANRGECPQYCRLPYELQDASGKIISPEKHFLSLKDMNRSANLNELIEAGVSSFKIEGRLKDVDYVKNITAFYRQKLDAALEGKTEYRASSSGKCRYTFVPNPEKSFNRGFTDYFLHRRKPDMVSFVTPKSIGEYIGTVKSTERNFMTLTTKKIIHNGDGLCFLTKSGAFSGFRVNKAEDGKIFFREKPDLPAGTSVYRNYDKEFDACLSAKSSERKIKTDIVLSENPHGFTLSAEDEDHNRVSLVFPVTKEPADKPQQEIIVNQLKKTGNTIFAVDTVRTELTGNWFIPASVSADWRRKLIDRLIVARKINYRREWRRKPDPKAVYPVSRLTYTGNVSNAKARLFYEKHGVTEIDPAFELSPPKEATLMFAKHCIKFSLNLCPKISDKKTVQEFSRYREPFYLVHNRIRMKLEFDCKQCEMLLKQE